MGKGKSLTEFEKCKITTLQTFGWSNRKIAKEIRRSFDVINRFVKNPKKYGNKKHTEHKPKISPRMQRRIISMASNSTMSVNGIRSELEIPESKMTVWRVINKNSHIAREKMQACPNLTPQHRTDRMEFYFDEKKFNLDGPDGWSYYWRDLRKEPRYFSRQNFGGGSVMVWLGFSSFGVTTVAFVPPKTDSVGYQKILADHLLPYLRRFPSVKFTFQQDNAAIHVSRTNKKGRKGSLNWLEEQEIDVLKNWTARSCDWNPMENLWSVLVCDVYANCRQFNKMDQLKDELTAAVSRISQEILKNLVQSMPNQMFLTIKNNGGYTGY